MGLLSDYLPNWLPDDPNQNQAVRNGLLNFGAAMLQGRGNFGNALGGGIAAGTQGYGDAIKGQQQAALNTAQTQRWNLENQGLQNAIDAPKRIREALASQQSAQPSAAASLASGGSVLPVQSLPTIGQDQPPQTEKSAQYSDQGYTGQSPQADPSQSSAPPVAPLSALPVNGQAPTAQTINLFAKYRGMGDALSNAGEVEAADKYYKLAQQFQPKLKEQKVLIQNGKPVNVMTYEDGTQATSAYGALPENQIVDLGGRQIVIDKNSAHDGQTFEKTQTKDSIASNALTAARLAFDKTQASTSDDEPMDPLAIRMTAQQYLAGDSGALQNFGRGAQGAKNLNAVRLEVSKQATAAGMTGADIAAKMAEFKGIVAGQRTAGVRSANIEIAASEVSQLVPLALAASEKVVRSGFLPFGKAQILFDSNTNDPNMRQFAMANTALVNAYGQAMARGGAATVSDKDHARKLLSTAFDQKSYAAAVAQLQQETRAAQAAPKAVRKDLSAAVGGRDSAPSAPAIPNGWSVKAH